MIVPVRKTTKWWWRQELANSWFTVYYTLLWFYWQSLLEESVGKCRSPPLWSYTFVLRNRVYCKWKIEGLYKIMKTIIKILTFTKIGTPTPKSDFHIKKEITLKSVMESPKLYISRMEWQLKWSYKTWNCDKTNVLKASQKHGNFSSSSQVFKRPLSLFYRLGRRVWMAENCE